MADSTEKKVLIDVEIKAKEALKEYANLKIKVDELRVAQEVLKIKMKGVDDSTDEGKQKLANLRLEYETIGQQIKAYNKEAQNQQKEIQSNIRYQNEAAGSLQKLKSELSLNTAAFNKLSEAERNSVKGQMLQKQIQETTEKLKDEEKALGNHRREVGNYALAGKELKQELKDLTNQLISMAEAGEKDSEQYKELLQRATELQGKRIKP
jgi:chromosome segregation ATPase